MVTHFSRRILRTFGLAASFAVTAAAVQATPVPAPAAPADARAACGAAGWDKSRAACKTRTLGAAARAAEPYRPVLIIPAGMAHH